MKLVDKLIKDETLKSRRIIKAFREVDRADFVPSSLKDLAYLDRPLSIGFGATISQPTTVAIMLELLSPKRGQKTMDVGSGSGFTTALLGKIVGAQNIYATEIVIELLELGRKNTAKYGIKPRQFYLADEKILGLPFESPFDRILVSASVKKIPRRLLEQLAIGGRMMIPVKNSLFLIYKDKEAKIRTVEFPGFIFLPLIY